MKCWLPLLILLITTSSIAQRPKIGLTLSGGGAKGLAHIGILKAIDSAGLKIDYVTGTSIGAIFGGLYAIGYSGDTLEKMVRQVDWDVILSNQASLRSLYMEEKNEYNKYIVELPWLNNQFRLPSGLLEGQELWMSLADLCYPVYNKKNFSQFSIPFKCISTEVGNGSAVVLDTGEIVSALRSSMAIPSVFTAVDVDGKRLIDGGIVRNFPVWDVRAMGADYVIGSNVATGLLPSDQVRNVIQVLLQVAFFREAEDNRKEVPLCNVYVPHKLEKYTMGSFSQAEEILEEGIDQGRKLYPVFKHLADSLDSIYGKSDFEKTRVPKVKPTCITEYEVKGVDQTTEQFLMHTMNFKLNRTYSSSQLNEMMRKAYGTRYYNRVTYSLIPKEDSTAKIIFDVAENALTFAKVGLHYNRFTGIGVIANITSRNFFISNSRSLVTLNVGESINVRAEHLQYLGRKKNFSLVLGTQFDRFDVTSYDQFKADGIYQQSFFKLDGKLQYSLGRNIAMGAGSRFEWLDYTPSIRPSLSFTGRNNFMTTYAFMNHNSLDRNIFPKSGIKWESEFGWVFNQHPDLTFYLNSQPISDPDSIKIGKDPYARVLLNAEQYIRLGKKSNLELELQSGVNFNYTNNVMNEFVVGGLTRTFRNQVTFAGLQEGTLYAPSVIEYGMAYRYEMFNNTYISARANVLFTNFISKSSFFTNVNFYSGYALTFSYNFALGPLELSAMYSDQSHQLSTYINLGIPF
jgi:NTE family protein